MTTTTRRTTLTALAAPAALAALLAPAGPATAATATATATATTAAYDCGAGGSGTLTLTAATTAATKSIRIESTDITTQFPYPADSVTSTLTLDKTTGGATSQVTFSGTVNPAAAAGDPIAFGPLPLTTGTLTTGDTTDSHTLTGTPNAANWSLSLTVTNSGGTFTSYCTATSAQSTPLTW
ncbi:hypothetical protein ACGFZL_17370 [Streptomyces sp. NPDC048182]|uniref:hypothetical protein n=1 Tax=Streptomyces sp. NPDC048182 TaxID=3365507 RepID=UPI003711FCCD